MVKSSNIVLKVNLSGSGYSFVWREKPSFEIDVDGYLPKAPTNVTGPNLAVCSMRLSTNSLLLGTVSRWGISDEFGRKGLILSQGHLVDLEANGSAIEVCEYLLGLMRTHELYFDELGETLEYLAKHGKRNDAEDLIGKIEKTAKMELNTATSELINHLTARLKTETRESNDAIRVYTELPWSANLGSCALIGLQVDSPAVKSVGAGRLALPQTYQLISSPMLHSGFRYVDLNRALSSSRDLAPTLQELDSVTKKTVDKKINTRKTHERGSNRVTIAVLFVSTIMMTCATTFFIYRNNQQRKLLQALSNIAYQKPNPSPQSDGPTADQQLQAEDTRLIAALYDPDRRTRISAITALQRNQFSHDRIIPLALQYARQHPTNDDGIENTLIVLKSVSPETLVKHNNEIKDFIDTVKNRNPKISSAANKVLLLSGSK